MSNSSLINIQFTRKPVSLDSIQTSVSSRHPGLPFFKTFEEKDILPKNILDYFENPMPDYFILVGKNGLHYLVHTAGYDYARYVTLIKD